MVFTQVSSALLSEQAPRSAMLMARLAHFADPELGIAQAQLARVLIGNKRPLEALPVIDTLTRNPLHGVAAADLRLSALVSAGDLDGAMAVARAAAEAKDADPASQFRLGEVLSRMDRHADAADAYAAANAAQSAKEGEASVSWLSWWAEGRERHLAGDWPRAKIALRKAVAAGPTEATALNHLGYSMLEAGDDPVEAMGLIAKAAEQRPTDPAITDSLGWAFFRIGEPAKAIGLLERAMALDPTIGEISDHLGDAYWAVGRRIDARYAWNAALIQSEGADADRIRAKIDKGPGRR